MNDKLTFSAGIINIVTGAFTFLYALIMALITIVALLMSFTIFFLGAIPVFIIFLALTALTFGAAITNAVVGVGSIVTSMRGGRISKVFSIVSVSVDGVFIPVCGGILALWTISLVSANEINWAAILFIISTFVVLALTVTSLVLHSVRLVKFGQKEPTAV